VRDWFEALLRETGLLAIAAGIALGWTAVKVAEATADLVVAFLDERRGGERPVSFFLGPIPLESLTIHVGDRLLVFAPLVHSLIAFAVVLLAAVFALRASKRRL
jgi:hypothetical protein